MSESGERHQGPYRDTDKTLYIGVEGQRPGHVDRRRGRDRDAGQHLMDNCGPGVPCHEGVRMAPGARNGPMKPPEMISTLTGTCMPSDLVLFRCSPEPGLGVARLCTSANNPAKSPPCSPPPHGGALSADGVREKIASGPAGRNGRSSVITTLCSRAVGLRSFLNLGAGRPLDKIGRGPCTSTSVSTHIP